MEKWRTHTRLTPLETADLVPLHFPGCLQVAVASEDPSALRGNRNKSQSSGPPRTAAQPGAAQPSSPLHLHGQLKQYDPLSMLV